MILVQQLLNQLPIILQIIRLGIQLQNNNNNNNNNNIIINNSSSNNKY